MTPRRYAPGGYRGAPLADAAARCAVSAAGRTLRTVFALIHP
ncbi:hypothetical protein SCATT_06680 [Streptantibioticus cattleyicolor NRRL 8057 = DSM 46488]|uniref:Uncharacterized protein n=1 Tax=Streptantibioticus cattleyicolor (strain ATCC 35852 / DSM 46488 / JCM 4925 / NBRC 14057 / NRRL 8057) TaxID=1003195 RepID=G8WTF6_STREN|nr:hypothetical protein SCATT_06680 [Streptantibioticus cattleyicolor NRRL 8057 = DSM 46488]